MSSTQTIGYTYKKLSTSWDKKRGTRDCRANVFAATTTKEPLYHVPSLVNHALCELHKRDDIVGELNRIEPSATIVGADLQSIWVYDARASDAAPRTEQDTARLKWFVTLFIKNHFDPQRQAYLLQHITITMCFFAWFFATPNYFYATKEMRQTTRFGIQKIWTETLLRKRPTGASGLAALSNTTPTTKQPKQPKSRGALHQKDSILPKLEEEKRAKETKIDALIQSEHPTHVFDWTDARSVHTKVSECFDMNDRNYINGKKSKKLQALYQEYQRVQDKVAHTKKGIVSAEAQQQRTEKQRAEKQRTEKQRTLPPAPAQKDDAKYIADQIWQQFVDHGCGVEETKGDEAPEDIPESWEDL